MSIDLKESVTETLQKQVETILKEALELEEEQRSYEKKLEEFVETLTNSETESPIVDELDDLHKRETELNELCQKKRNELLSLKQALRNELVRLQKELWQKEVRDRRRRMSEVKELLTNTLDSSRATRTLTNEKVGSPFQNQLTQEVTIVNGKIVELSEWEIDPKELELSAQVLGSGMYGTVYKGKYQQLEVAIKKLFVQDMDGTSLSEFCREVRIISTLRHPNVLMFLGASTKPGKLCMVTEFMAKSSLETFLHGKSTEPIPWTIKMQIAKGIAQGMNWLHTLQDPILHLDLKPANLLLDEHHNPKISDFGMSQLKQEARNRQVGSPIYMAPEVLSGQEYDTKADIYSFGVVLWEIVTQKIPYERTLHSFSELKAAVLRGERPKFSEDFHGPDVLKDLITSCWHPDPTRRPSFKTMLHNKIFDTIVIKALIGDHNKSAQTMWTKEFFGTWVVNWKDFVVAFEKHMQASLSNDRNIQVELFKLVLGITATETKLSIESFANILEWFGPAATGNDLLKQIQSLTSQPWFHGALSKETAEQYLIKDHQPGAFLVRFSSSSPGCFTISAISKDKDKKKQITHFKVVRKGLVFQLGQETYSSLEALVQNQKSLPKQVYIRKPVDSPSMFQVILTANKMVETKKMTGESIYALPEDNQADKKKK